MSYVELRACILCTEQKFEQNEHKNKMNKKFKE